MTQIDYEWIVIEQDCLHFLSFISVSKNTSLDTAYTVAHTDHREWHWWTCPAFLPLPWSICQESTNNETLLHWTQYVSKQRPLWHIACSADDSQLSWGLRVYPLFLFWSKPRIISPFPNPICAALWTLYYSHAISTGFYPGISVWEEFTRNHLTLGIKLIFTL